MQRNDDQRNRPRRRPADTDLHDYTGVQRGVYGRYDEDDWQPRERAASREADWDYGNFSAERGSAATAHGDWPREPRFPGERQRGDYRDHYGGERGHHPHEGGYYGAGSEAATRGAGAHGGYAESIGGAPGSGAYGRPRGRPGEDFRGRGPKNYQRSDERLCEDINERLTAAADIDAGDIRVEVNAGTVVLHGYVDRRQTRYRVEDLVERCSGVRDIDNRLRVGPAPADSSAERGEGVP